MLNNIEKVKASRMEELRKELGLTNIEFADLLQVSESQARNYQKCRQPIPEDIIDRLSNGNDLLKDWLLCKSDYKSVSDIIDASASILRNASNEDLKWQETVAYLLNRFGYTQANVGFDTYTDFLDYMDIQIKHEIQMYLKFLKR